MELNVVVFELTMNFPAERVQASNLNIILACLVWLESWKEFQVEVLTQLGGQGEQVGMCFLAGLSRHDLTSLINKFYMCFNFCTKGKTMHWSLMLQNQNCQYDIKPVFICLIFSV